MSIQLDHVIVPARDRRASAQLLATILGAWQGGRIVYWSEPDGHVWEALTVS